MGYHLLDPSDVASTASFPCDRRPLGEIAGLSQLHLALYEVDPGEALARQYHRHRVREEAFYVLDGELSVRTPEETFTVQAGQVFVAESDSPLYPHVPEGAPSPCRVFGTGAPLSDPGLPHDPD